MNNKEVRRDKTGNLIISKADLAFIKSLEDFDLIMLLSEIEDNGWFHAQNTLVIMKEALKK